MKRAILILIILFFLSSCDTDFQAKEGRVHLIIVALDYSNAKYVSNLIGPINDAKEIGACLESHYKRRSIPFDAIYLIAEGSMANEKDECYPSAENIIFSANTRLKSEHNMTKLKSFFIIIFPP